MKSIILSIFIISVALIGTGIGSEEDNDNQDEVSLQSFTLSDFAWSCLGIYPVEAKGGSGGGRSSGGSMGRSSSFGSSRSVSVAKSVVPIKSSFKSVLSAPVGTTKTYGGHSLVYKKGGWHDALTGFLVIDALSDNDQENEDAVNNYYAQDAPFGLIPIGLAFIGGYALMRRNKVNMRRQGET